jgi:phospholipid/cholesterol/gamma-HCH transport system ATP-binding protein
VRQNLEFPLRRHKKNIGEKEVKKLVAEALENVGLEKAINLMPAELSGGMRKRIGLARALILKPEIILYDEPTTGLDPITSREISHLMLEVQQKYNTSSMIITHDIACVKALNARILLLDEGKFAAEGNFTELQNSENPEVRMFFE